MRLHAATGARGRSTPARRGPYFGHRVLSPVGVDELEGWRRGQSGPFRPTAGSAVMAIPPTLPPRVPASKIVVPEPPAGFTPRPALRQLLDRASAGQVIVVSAPAGFGKTLLLADWVRNDRRLETAWVSLDVDDNDPRRLWSAVVAALLAVPSLSRDGALQRVAGVAALPGRADVAEELADALDALDPPVRIVLDDVHELTSREVLRDVAQLVRFPPAGVRLVLAGRADPAISVPRLRLEGRLHELRADVLRFTLGDTAALLTASGLELTAAQVAVLHARTEGWAAGLRLAVLALRRSDDPDAFLTAFSGDERSVADYLTSEILAELSPETRDFWRVASVCAPLPAGLAVELSGRADAERLLEELRRETALVERTSPGVYPIPALLRSYLIADLAPNPPAAYPQLQAAAARRGVAQDGPGDA